MSVIQNSKEMKVSVVRINPYLVVQNISASIRYFVDVLGFDAYIETPNLGIVERDGHQIHLSKSIKENTTHQLWMGVDDVEVLFEQFKGTGAIISQEPTNYSWAYQMVVEDHDGNKLIIGSGPKDDQPYQD